MSIILKGIDMPIDGESITVTIWNDGIIYATDENKNQIDTKESEAIQIPKGHGNIIDRSDIEIGRWDIDTDLAEQIQNAPTILEAEES